MDFLLVLSTLTGLLTLGNAVLPELHQVHTKFQFMYSFKGPYLTDSEGGIPFWNHGGSAIASEDSVRVCPSLKSRRGWVWTKNVLSASHWFMDVTVKVTGRVKSGADGMAIWLTSEPGSEGQVYGNIGTWTGVGLFLDSFDNDGMSDNPKIQLVLNDGSKNYEHYSDGKTQESSSCLKDFRNKPYPVKIRMSYVRRVLEVWVHDGTSLSDDDYEPCLKLEGVPELAFIPKDFYLGVTAATGGLSDDHDVTSFLTSTVVPLEEKAMNEIQFNNTAYKMASQKYSEMAGEFDERKDSYQRQHPERAQKFSTDFGSDKMDWQSQIQVDQSIRLVADMQVALQKEMRNLATKVDMVLARASSAPATPGSHAGVPPGDARTGDVYRSLVADMSQIKTTEGNILHQLADLRAAMDRSVPEGGKAAASEQLQPVYEIKNTVGQQKLVLDAMARNIQDLAQTKCPPPAAISSPTTCLTPWLFVAVVIIQMAVLFGYTCYRDMQERNAKKFF